MCGKRFLGKRIELSSPRVLLDHLIEMPRLEFFEPRAKSRKLRGSELLDGFLDVFNRGHDRYIAVTTATEKT